MTRTTDSQPNTDQPTYNSSPTSIFLFLSELEPWLLLRSSNYRLLLQKGTVIVRQRTYVLNPTHARLLKAGAFPTHSFASPSPSTIAHDRARAATACGSTESAAVDAALIALTASESERFCVNPEQIEAIDTDMMNDILSCYPHQR